MADKNNNIGIDNSGDWNSGNRNSGDRNSGNRNSGDWNSGNWNSGNWNSGRWNSGDWNSGDWNSGYFNTNEPKARFFNKDSEYTNTEFRNKFGYTTINLPITRWIDSSEMTDDEKKSVKGWETMGGYLKTLSYKEAWKKGWDEANEEQRAWFKNLPNFDAAIFKEITGIDVEDVSMKGTEVEVKFAGKTYKAIIQ